MVDYPYRNDIYSNNDRITRFLNLKSTSLTFVAIDIKPYVQIKLHDNVFLYKGQYWYIRWNTKDYDKVHILSDLFIDTCRSKCSFGDYMSPYIYYKKNKKILINSILSSGNTVNSYNLREAIYKNIPECSTHNPTIIKFFIKYFKAKNILDMCAGWGDRLLGALSSDIDFYMGVDPNPCNHPCYQNMINLLKPYSPNPKAKYLLINSKFEELDIGNYTFDLMFSSPPYFDYEKYTNDPGQSHISFTNENTWYENFLQPSIIKCVSVLKYGGYMVLYISQQKGKTYMEKLLTWLPHIPNVYYMGAMHYTDEKPKIYSHPVFIFRKYDKIPATLYNPISQLCDNNIPGRRYVDWLRKLLQKKINKLFCKNSVISYLLYLLKRNDIILIMPTETDKKIYDLCKFYHNNTTLSDNTTSCYIIDMHKVEKILL